VNIAISAILSPEQLGTVEKDLDLFTNKISDNPFLLSLFIKEEMRAKLKNGYSPIVLIFRHNNEIVGVAHLLVRTKFGINYTRSLSDYWFSPDLVFNADYQIACSQALLNYIFNNLNCPTADLILPSESTALKTLNQICKKKGIKQEKIEEPYLGHAVIQTGKSWEDFEKEKGSKWRSEFKNIRRRLDKLGPCEIEVFDQAHLSEDIIEKVSTVEKASWKQDWRLSVEVRHDEQLLRLIELSNLAVNTYDNFSRVVLLLQVNKKPIAYAILLKYRRVGYILKSTFDETYRKQHPGLYIVNESIRTLFDSGDVNFIDFMTNIPATQKWDAVALARVNVCLSNGWLPKLFRFGIKMPFPSFVKQLAKKVVNI
jgi:hypothetical protein